MTIIIVIIIIIIIWDWRARNPAPDRYYMCRRLFNLSLLSFVFTR